MMMVVVSVMVNGAAGSMVMGKSILFAALTVDVGITEYL